MLPTELVSSVPAWRVVIIEDSLEDRDEIRRLLLNGSDRRYQFAEAETGSAGILAVLDTLEGPPDCVVLDHKLPDMGALEVLAAIVGPNGMTACPVVVLTGNADARLGSAVLKGGAQDFIGKATMTAEGLTRALENATERWAMVRELRAKSAALQVSEAQLQLAAEVAGLGVARIDYQTHTIVLDALAGALFGLTAGVPLPRNVVHGTFHPDDTDEISRRINTSLGPTGDGRFSMEHRVVHRDGSTRWLLVRKQVTFGNVGGVRCPVSSVLAAVDITERRRSDEALRESEARFRALTTASSDVVYSMSSDWSEMRPLDGRGVYVSTEAGSRTWLQDFTHPEDQPTVMARIHDAIRTKSIVHLEHRVRRVDGTWGWTYSRAVPMLDVHGEILEWFGTASDVTARKEAEAALRDSTALLRAISDSTGDVIFAKDREGRLTYANAATLARIGKPLDEVLGKTDAEFLDDTSAARQVMANDRRIIDSGIFEEMEEQVPLPDGTIRIWLSRKSPHRDAAGSVIGLLGVSSDLTARLRAAEALRESEARYRSLFENMLDGFAYCQICCDEQGQPDDFVYLAVNDAFGRLTGLNNVTGKRVTQVIPGIKELHPELFDTYGRVAATGIPEQCEIDVTPLGLRLSVNVYCPMTGYFVAVLDDITQRTQTEEVLRESEQRFRLMADGLPLVIWVHDAQGQLSLVNHTYCEFFGVTVQQVAGKDWQPLVHSDDVEAYAVEFSACVRDRRPFHAEVRVRRFDGEWRWLESSAQPRFSASGEFLGMVGSSPDITDRKAAADQLQQLAAELSEANRRKDEFLATLAHELRNPLAPIRNGLAILRMAHAPDLAANVVAMMDRQLGHLVNLVDDLLDVSRVRTGKVTLRAERMTVQEAVDAAVEACRPIIDQHSHTLDVELPAEPLSVVGDKTRLMQVVGNLLTNAAKYSEVGSRIRITAGREGGDAVIRVSDTGIGIAPDLLPSLWDLFTQVRDTLDKAQGGLGIGLSLVKNLVELHGGTVAAESAGVGHGSTFTVRLPLATTADETDAPSAEQNGSALTPSAGRRVLVVDDNMDAAASLSMLLQFSGHTTATAHSGAEALAVAPAFKPDIIFLDIGLPAGMDGYDVARRLRADPEMAGTVLVALTGWGSEDDRRKSLDAGFDGHLTKPVAPDAVHALIARYAALPAAGRERQECAVTDDR